MAAGIEDIKKAVREAGQLARLYVGKVTKGLKADLSVVTEADKALESFFQLSLAALDPAFGYLGEETEETRAPAAGETRYWVVDALDGSRAFASGMPLWTPAVCLMDGPKPLAGAAYNPITDELFWAGPEGPAYCNDQELAPNLAAELKPNSFIFASTNHHRVFSIDFPGRIYSLGAPIYQLCLLAKGSVSGFLFDTTLNLWDLALPSLLLERVGASLVYHSGRPVDLEELMDRRAVPEPIVAGGPEMVLKLRRRVTLLSK